MGKIGGKKLSPTDEIVRLNEELKELQQKPRTPDREEVELWIYRRIQELRKG